MKLFSTFLIFSILLSCQSDSRNNPRAYVEGKITASTLQFEDINITIKDGKTIVAETIPTNSGDFILSGPLLSDSFSLVFNSKIKSFKASKSGTSVSADSMQIIVPAGTTYINFNEIKLK